MDQYIVRGSSDQIKTVFGLGDTAIAFLLILPISFLGAACLTLARRHIEVDAAKVFEAVVLALAAQQTEELALAQEDAGDASAEGGDKGDT